MLHAEKIHQSESSQLWHFIRDSIILSPTKETTRIIFYLVLICCSIIFLATGSSDSPGSPVLLSLMLFHFFFRNSYIGLVLQAVTSTAQQLMYTLFGMVIVMFIFAVIAFKYFHNDFDAGQCLEMWYAASYVQDFMIFQIFRQQTSMTLLIHVSGKPNIVIMVQVLLTGSLEFWYAKWWWDWRHNDSIQFIHANI